MSFRFNQTASYEQIDNGPPEPIPKFLPSRLPGLHLFDDDDGPAARAELRRFKSSGNGYLCHN